MKLYSWGTPNGRKVSIALEEMGLTYETVAIDIGAGDQDTPEFRQMNPNGKIPVLKDGDRVIFESGAILLYLAQKTGQFCPPHGTPGYWDVLQWLMWQMGGFGPMLGQAHHFLHFNPGKSDYAEARFAAETRRLYAVLDQQLETRPHICGDLTIADFAVWPWVSRFGFQKIDLNGFPHVRKWYLRLAERPGFIAGYAVPDSSQTIPHPDD